MLLSLMAASLAQCENLLVVRTSTWKEIDALAVDCIPDVLIYDLDTTSESHMLALLFKNPDLLLIGLDVECNRAVLLAGKETRSLTLERVKEILLTY